jgi:hypothetical protein
MSILFQKDWTDEHGNLRAVPHLSTTNESFLRTCAILKKLNIKNYAFPLALYDPDLKDVDPHKLEDNTEENNILRTKVIIEARRNIWYFIREVIRIYNQGGPPVPFKLTRGSLAMLWCFFNSIDYATMQPRQAQPLDAIIKTPDGYLTMGDMKVGTIVLSPDGKPIKVKGVYPQGIKDVYKVTLKDGRSTECCKDHLWRVYTDTWTNTWKVMSLEQIMESRDSKYIPIWLPGNKMVLSSIESIELIGQKEVQCIEVDHPDHLYITDNDIITHNTGKLSPLYSKILTPSGWVRNGDLKLGERVVTPDGGSAPVTGIYPHGEVDIFKITLSDGRSTDCGLEHLWKVSGSHWDNGCDTVRLKDIMDSIENGIPIENNYIPVYDPENISISHVSIKSIEYIGKHEAQCIEVDHPDHLYITDDYIVTHNTVAALAIYVWLLFCGGNDSQLGMLCKDNKLREDNVARIKRISECLPSWWIAVDKNHDKSNATAIKYTALQMELSTVVAQDNPVEADKQGRGGTMPVFWWDEFEFCQNIGISYSTIIASGGAARINAKKNGKPYSNLITTTAGDPMNPACKEAAAILDGAMPFGEFLYDLEDNEKLHEVVAANSPQKMIIGIFSHLQLGLSNDWLRDEIRKAKMTPDKVMREYLNRRVSLQEKPVIPQGILNTINASQMEPKWTQLLNNKFVIRWYIDRHIVESTTFKNKPIVVGCDSSEMIGKDATTLVGIDPATLEVVFTFRCNEGNIPIVGVQIAKLLMMYPKMIFVPENKSSGTSLIDIVALMLRKEGHNPFTRIFNWVVNNREDPKFAAINIRDMSLLDTSIKKFFGIKTSKESRTELYSTTLLDAVSMGASRVRDQTLIQELGGLTERNGRVDHTVGANDDLTVAYLLCFFFIFNAKNLDVYGLSKHNVMRSIDKVGDDKARVLKEKQDLIIAKIEQLEENLKYQTDPGIKMMLEGDIEMFKGMIDTSIPSTPRYADELHKDPRKFIDRDIAEASKPKVDPQEVLSSVKMLLGL